METKNEIFGKSDPGITTAGIPVPDSTAREMTRFLSGMTEGRRSLAGEIINHCIDALEVEFHEELTDDERQIIQNRVLNVWSAVSASDTSFARLVADGELGELVREFFEDALNERKHYYRVSYTVSYSKELWVKANNLEDAKRIADNADIYEVADEVKLNTDIAVDEIYEDDDGYDGEDVLE